MGRKFTIGILVLALLAGGVWYWYTQLRGPKWNVLVVTLGSTRADHIGCYGNTAAKTPAFDELAQRGVLFERAYATAPVTLPSHATIFTGLQPVEHTLLNNGNGQLPGVVETLAEVLAANGYQTAAFVGAYALDSKFGLDQGFATYDDDLRGNPPPADRADRERPGNMVVDRALEWLEQNKAERFHCWIQLNDPRLPYVDHTVTVGPTLAAPTTVGTYDGELAFADQQLGRVLAFLKDQKLDDKTLVVVVGDHGEGLGEHDEQGAGYLLHDSTLRVPLVVSQPGSPAARVKEPVSLVDVCPTLLELLGLKSQQRHSGASLTAAWQSGAAPSRSCYSATYIPLLENGWSAQQGVTTADWKYVRSTTAELYDLSADPGEAANVASSQVDRVAELDKLLTELESKLQPAEAATAALAAAEARAGTLYGVGAEPAVLPDVTGKLALYNRLREARQLLASANPQLAEPILREVVVADPRFLHAWETLGICLRRLEKLDEAIECFQKVLAVNDTDESALLNLGDIYALQEKTDDAMSVYRKANAAHQDSAAPAMQLGLLQQKLGDEGQAEVLFALAVERDPNYDPAICAQGELALQQGDGDRAFERYQVAMFMNPKSVPALVNVGIIAAQMGEIDVAESLFKQAVEVEPRNPLPRLNLARIATYRGRPEDTAVALEAILQDSPEDVATLLALGWIRATSPVDALRNREQAQTLAEQVITVGGRNSVEALDLLAATLAEAGKFEEAVNTLVEAYKLAKDAGYSKESLEELEKRVNLYARGGRYRSEPAQVPQKKPAPQ